MEVSRYDSVADWYVAWVDASPWVHRVIMLHRARLGMGLPPGSRVLDLGCGEGLFSRVLEQDGYRVVGIDLSERLVDAARMRGPDTIAFVVDDAQTLISQGVGSFDGAICVLALMDIPDIGAVFQAAHRVVRPGGTFACVLMHPAFDGPGARWLDDAPHPGRLVTQYLTEGEWTSPHVEGVRGRVGAHHRTLGTYITTAIASGWHIHAIEEWPGLPGETPNDDIPRLLFLQCRRASDGAAIRENEDRAKSGSGLGLRDSFRLLSGRPRPSNHPKRRGTAAPRQPWSCLFHHLPLHRRNAHP